MRDPSGRRAAVCLQLQWLADLVYNLSFIEIDNVLQNIGRHAYDRRESLSLNSTRVVLSEVNVSGR